MGRDVRAWPMLALLLLVILVAIGCVLWFMNEAVRNERMAVREKLGEAYRGHLAFVQAQAARRWNAWREQLDGVEPAPARFEHCVRENLADGAVCFDEHGAIAHPRPARPPSADAANSGAELQAALRALVQDGKKDEAVQFVIEKLATQDDALDAQGRVVAANAELLALDLLADKADARFQQIAARLRRRVADYATSKLPSTQRRFIMRELQRLDSGAGPTDFAPALAAEDLAASYLETNSALPTDGALHPAGIPDLWIVLSPARRTLALLTDARVRSQIDDAMHDSTLPRGVGIKVFSPRDEATIDAALVTAPLGAAFPGWRLALFLDDRTFLDTEAAKRVKFHIVLACVVIATMSVLTLLIARSFGRQVQLTRLKNDLVATVSHELKTPLTAMRALVETLLDSERLDEKTTREYLQLLARENARLSRLIENFLTFSRLERSRYSFALAPLRPERLVESAVAAFGDRANTPGCTLESHVAPNLPAIRGDADALSTALLNLLDNAWKYSGDEKRIVLRCDATNGHVRLAVEDNGIGLSPRDQQRVFHRFYQADQRLARTAGGCGLGLNIAQSMVEAHDGSLTVRSEPGRGSTFTIELPAIPDSAR